MLRSGALDRELGKSGGGKMRKWRCFGSIIVAKISAIPS